MRTPPGIGQALAELVKRLTPEEKQELAHSLSWEDLEALRHPGPHPGSTGGTAAHSPRRVGEPRVYVSTTSDGLALELPVECVGAFVKRLPAILSVSSVEVYLRRNGQGEEQQVGSEEFADFLDAYRDVLVEGSLMLELGDATLVSGGGGCLLLTLEGTSRAVRRQLAKEALRACGFDYELVGDHFTATVWDDSLEVSGR
jgi:hypothetical protein